MPQLPCIEVEEMPGKTIKGAIHADGNLLIAFEDGDVIQFYASSFSREDSEICVNSYMHPTDFNINDLEQAFGGMHTDITEAVRKNLETKKEMVEQETIAFEKSELERLKKKYEPSQPTNLELAT